MINLSTDYFQVQNSSDKKSQFSYWGRKNVRIKRGPLNLGQLNLITPSRTFHIEFTTTQVKLIPTPSTKKVTILQNHLLWSARVGSESRWQIYSWSNLNNFTISPQNITPSTSLKQITMATRHYQKQRIAEKSYSGNTILTNGVVCEQSFADRAAIYWRKTIK